VPALEVGCIELNTLPPEGDGGTGGASHRGGAPAAHGGASGGSAGASGDADGGSTPHGEGGSGASEDGGSHGTGDGGSSGALGHIEGGAGSGLGGDTAEGGVAGADDEAGGTGSGGESGGAGGDEPSVDVDCELAPLDPNDALELVPVSGDIGVHDPVVIEADGLYYMFHTGVGISVKTSTNLREWSNAGVVFGDYPSWIAQKIPGVSNLWAPDISFFGGQYHLYYSASTFGSNRSCIGHATRTALDSGQWTDHGPVICSNETPDTDDWNAIDPNLVLDESGKAYLSFGSFWSGIKMIELDEDGARANNTLHSLAERTTAGRSIEAPFIVRRCSYYYLFVSFDYCCRGSNSTYRIMVGRSKDVRGPYLDRDGTPLVQNGGTLVLQGTSRWRGPGHNAILFVGQDAYNVYHAYDANDAGRAKLRIAELAWDESGWPKSAGP